MKIKSTSSTEFKPFAVTIDIESLTDLAMMLSVCNQSVMRVMDSYNRFFEPQFKLKGVVSEQVANAARGPLYQLWQVFNKVAEEINEQP